MVSLVLFVVPLLVLSEVPSEVLFGALSGVFPAGSCVERVLAV